MSNLDYECEAKGGVYEDDFKVIPIDVYTTNPDISYVIVED